MEKNYQRELYEVATNVKNAIFAEWEASDENNKFFCDKSRQNCEKGLLFEGIGATTVLLLLAAFEKNVFSDKDIETCNKIINTSFVSIRNMSEDGYLATPVLLAEEGRKAFNKDKNAGYIDTVTWCLSSAILARYNERRGLLHLEDDVREYVFDAIANGIRVLCDSQNKGLWGFRTDLESQRSLYFTYSASASIADFFDYILGEVGLLSLPIGATEEEKESAVDNACDREIINYINQKYNCNIKEDVTRARNSLCGWIISDALPLLPKVASCDKLEQSELDLLGIWNHQEMKDTSKVFYHLYYAFYLLDMMVTAGADTYFQEIVKNPDELKALAEDYRSNGKLNDVEFFYYFYDNEFDEQDILSGEYHYDEFFNKTVEQALYTARVQYANASKTRNDFWNKAELELKFFHPKKTVSDALRTLSFSDPSVIAIALRANITYSYYVTETQDIAIERLFDELCNDVYSEKYRGALSDNSRNNRDRKCVVNLWDCTNYSLPLTERAVEALVDFKDYLDKFYSDSPSGNKQVEFSAPTKVEYVAEPSAIDLAVESKIAEYLQSEAGKKLIEDACAAKLASVTNSGVSSNVEVSLSDDKVLQWLNDWAQDIDQCNPENLQEREQLDAWKNFFEALQKYSLFKKVHTEIQHDSAIWHRLVEEYDVQKEQLLKDIFKDIAEQDRDPNNNSLYALPELYKALKSVRD